MGPRRWIAGHARDGMLKRVSDPDENRACSATLRKKLDQQCSMNGMEDVAES
jgi:hypothetical protein